MVRVQEELVIQANTLYIPFRWECFLFMITNLIITFMSKAMLVATLIHIHFYEYIPSAAEKYCFSEHNNVT
jgi:hypothetical protein